MPAKIGAMKRIKVIAVVLSMVLLLVGAAGNTEEETRNSTVFRLQQSQKRMLVQPAQYTLVTADTIKIETTRLKNVEYVDLIFRITKEATAEVATEAAEESTEEITEEITEVREEPQRIIELSEEDYTVLLKLVEAEASGEDMKGKMLVANVVLNRLEEGSFGSTVKEVIYQRVNGKAQFSPVANGRINKVEVSDETVEAVERVLCGEDESQGALYFVARKYASAKNLAWFERNLTRLFEYEGHEFYA